MMRLIVNALTLLGVLIALFSTLLMGYGFLTGKFPKPANLTVMLFQLWALIGGLMALTFGYLGRVMDRRAKRPFSKLSRIGLITGTAIGLCVIGVVIFG